MAKQHFYSCVPAKMSLFNRMDGYDTFAYSEGITREWIEAELSAVYSNKPTKEDAARILSGTLPPVYAQFEADDGTLVQSAVGFIPSDYTGERSAYLVHSLVLSPEERASRLGSPDAATLTADSFLTDIASFALNDPDSRPSTTYPEATLSTEKAGSTAELVERYDTGMLKRLIYALIGIPCGKTKTLFLSLPLKAAEFSAGCLDFINRMLQIFPYHMRGAMSFVTYIGDISKFSGFRIRCVPENTPPIPAAKGISLRMGAKDYSGISDENIGANAVVVDFFYGLMSNDTVRRAFIEFCRHAVEAVPSLEKVSLKNLSDLILLFRALSGFFEEKTVLPNDDAVANYIMVYEKNREALTDEFRTRSMQCLKRYAAAQTAIPKNVFAKVANVYPTEPASSRHTVMQVVLELFHTAAMREKLFAFAKANYLSEEPDTRAAIMESVCRVYYGGFLQGPILEFLAEQFPNEPAAVRASILERLFLTVRTPAVQQRVLEFIDRFYPDFSESEKDRFYELFFEMLPDADDLTRALADLVDNHIEEERREAVAARVVKAVEGDERHHEPRLCAVLTTRRGFVEASLAKKVLTDWGGRVIVDHFGAAVGAKSLVERMATVREAFEAAPTCAPVTVTRFYAAVSAATGSARVNPFDLIAAADDMAALKETVPVSAEFVEAWQQQYLVPALEAALPLAFDPKRCPDGVEALLALAADRPYVRESAGYAAFAAYGALTDAVEAGQWEKLLALAAALPDETVRRGAAAAFAKDTEALTLSDEMTVAVAAVVRYLKTDVVGLYDGGEALRRVVNARGTEDAAAEEEILACLLKVAAALYESDISEEMRAAILADNGELARYIRSCSDRNPKKGKRTVSRAIDALTAPEAFLSALREIAQGKKESGGFFKRLFG